MSSSISSKPNLRKSSSLQSTTSVETQRSHYSYGSSTERTYFYKADDFPEVIVNERRELKTLEESAQLRRPR